MNQDTEFVLYPRKAIARVWVCNRLLARQLRVRI
jgi:hypothetical protein